MSKKILIITGSPRAEGNTNTLAQAFASGAEAAGNEVRFFHAAGCDMDGCHGEKNCFKSGSCGIKDDGQKVQSLMQWAEVLVLVSPLYWKSFTSQIKRVIDRFYQYAAPKGRAVCSVREAYLITAGNSPEEQAYAAIKDTYALVCQLLSFEDKGVLLAKGVGELGAIRENPEYIKRAIEMGYGA